jgi:hypothetical protein
VEGGITHLQYADDTIIMTRDEEKNIVNLKLILFGFESMSEMKINYHKNEVFVIGGSQEREEEIATKFNYKLGRFSMRYLEVPIHIKKFRKKDLQW